MPDRKSSLAALAMLGTRACHAIESIASIPFRDWPTRCHATAASTLVLAACAVALMAYQQLERHRSQVAQELQTARSELRRSSAAASIAKGSPEPALTLGKPQLDRLLSDIASTASRQAVSLISLRLEPPTATQPVLRVVVAAHGEYPALKFWLSELLASHPVLALHALELTNKANHLQGSITFGVQVRGTS